MARGKGCGGWVGEADASVIVYSVSNKNKEKYTHKMIED